MKFTEIIEQKIEKVRLPDWRTGLYLLLFYDKDDRLWPYCGVIDSEISYGRRKLGRRELAQPFLDSERDDWEEFVEEEDEGHDVPG